MRASLPDLLDSSLAAEELRAWGHDFNARDIIVNNQGQADESSALHEIAQDFGLDSLSRPKLQCRLHARSNVQLVVNMPQMPANGSVAEAETIGDFLVWKACGQ
jgi:hypothetical protein